MRDGSSILDRATMIQRPTPLGWAFLFVLPPLHAGNRRILRVPGGCMPWTGSVTASLTLFCPLFSAKRRQLFRHSTRTSPCATTTYACVDSLSSTDHLVEQMEEKAIGAYLSLLATDLASRPHRPWAGCARHLGQR